MSAKPSASDRFPTDIAEHRITILRDDGVYRHVRCAKPGTIVHSFDLVTWPGYLAYTGDMGHYVFTRTNDMFAFFRGGVNTSYWSEKVEASDRIGVRGWSPESFRANVRADYDQFVEDNDDDLSEDDRLELWCQIEAGILAHSEEEREAIEAVSRWHSDEFDVSFADFWEHDCTEFTYRYVWCCLAIDWAIARYDEAKAAGGASDEC